MSTTGDALRSLALKIDKIADDQRPTRYKDKVEPETVIIGALKKIGVPYSVAVRLLQEHNPISMARKIFLYEWRCSMATKKNKPREPLRFIQAAIKNDYNEPDEFLDWLKAKKEIIDVKRGEARIEFRRLLDLT